MLKLRRLRYFVKIAELQNFHRAAEQLNIAQPALTRQVMQLEAELGLQLFDRIPRGVRLTASGETFFIGAKRILADVDELFQSVQQTGSEPIGDLAVAFEDSVAQNPVIAKSMQILRKDYPKIKVNLLPLSERYQLERLRNREIDIGFAYDICGEFPRHNELDCHVIRRDKLVLVMPSDHELAEGEAVNVEDIGGEPFVMIARDKGPKLGYDYLMNACAKAGLTPRIVQEVPTIDGLFNLVSVGIGMTLCAQGVRSHLPDGVTMRPIRELDVSFDLTIMWRRHSQSAAARKFVEVVRSITPPAFAMPTVRSVERPAMALNH